MVTLPIRPLGQIKFGAPGRIRTYDKKRVCNPLHLTTLPPVHIKQDAFYFVNLCTTITLLAGIEPDLWFGFKVKKVAVRILKRVMVVYSGIEPL